MTASGAIEAVLAVASIGASIAATIVLKRRMDSGHRPHDYYVEDSLNSAGLDPESPITIARFTETYMADLCKAKLEAEGIDCTILNRPSINTGRSLRVEGGVQVAVMAKDAERAAGIIREVG